MGDHSRERIYIMEKNNQISLKNWRKLGEATANENLYVGIIFSEQISGEHTYFTSRSTCQCVDNSSGLLNDAVAVDRITVWATPNYENHEDIVYELVFKTQNGGTQSLFVDIFKNIVVADDEGWTNRLQGFVGINALEISVNGETWVDSIDYYEILYSEFGKVHQQIFNINGEKGVLVGEYTTNLL